MAAPCQGIAPYPHRGALPSPQTTVLGRLLRAGMYPLTDLKLAEAGRWEKNPGWRIRTWPPQVPRRRRNRSEVKGSAAQVDFGRAIRAGMNSIGLSL